MRTSHLCFSSDSLTGRAQHFEEYIKKIWASWEKHTWEKNRYICVQFLTTSSLWSSFLPQQPKIEKHWYLVYMTEDKWLVNHPHVKINNWFTQLNCYIAIFQVMIELVRRSKWFSILVELSFQRLNANDGHQFLMFFSPQYRVCWVFIEHRHPVRQMCKPSLCWSNSQLYYLYLCVLCYYRDLSKNQISEIAEDAFSGLRSLTSL